MNKHAKHFLAAGLASLPLVAMAHSGHAGHGFADGFQHPFLGLDHLAAMLVVGIWSVLHSKRVWLAPLTFVSLLALGAIAGQHGLSVPQLEPLVAASVLVFGLLLAHPLKLGNNATLGIIAAFAFCHGLAHGSELAASASVLSGIVAGSALLHGMGMLLAQRFLRHRSHWALRLGQATALLGGGLLLNAII